MFLFVYRNEEEKEGWAEYLTKVSPKVEVVVNDRLFSLLNYRDVNPKVLCLSSSLIVEHGCLEIVGNFRCLYPDLEVCVLLSYPEDTINYKCLIDYDIKHVIIRPRITNSFVKDFYKDRFSLTLSKIANKEKLTLADYVNPAVKVYVEEVKNSEDKEIIIEKINALIGNDGEDLEFFKQRVSLLADEMLENALYGAPRAKNGVNLFKKGQKREILDEERIYFSYAFDGRTFTMEITDSWGTLDPRKVLEVLDKNTTEGPDFENPGGRGFFIMSRFFDVFLVAVKPGEETKVGGLILVDNDFDPETHKEFHLQIHTN